MNWNNAIHLATAVRGFFFRVQVVLRCSAQLAGLWWRRALAVGAASVGILLLCVIVADDSATGLRTEDARLQLGVDRLEQVNAGIQAQNKALEHTLKSLKSNQALLEHNVREDLGFIRDGEVVVVLPR